jgi:hypothetical protein
LLARDGVALVDELLGQWRRRGARGVRPGDREGPAPCRPVVVDLANDQLRWRRWGESPLERAVRVDVEFAVVEGGLTVRHVVVGVLTTEQLEADVGGGTAPAGDDVLVAGLHAGAEVHGVRVVEAHLREGTGAGVQEGVVAVVVEGHVRARRDAPREVLQSFEQVRLGFDERRGGDQTLGLGDGVGQRL